MDQARQRPGRDGRSKFERLPAKRRRRALTIASAVGDRVQGAWERLQKKRDEVHLLNSVLTLFILAVTILTAATAFVRGTWFDPRPDKKARTISEQGHVVWDDFEGDAPSLNWSRPKISTTPSGRRFLGEFGPGTVTLTIEDLPEHSTIRVTFDLYIICSWDGDDREHGPDVFQLSIDRQSPFFVATFSNTIDSGQSYPDQRFVDTWPARVGAEENGTLGYWFRHRPKDSMYTIVEDLDHEDDDLQLHFSARNLGPLEDESWGLDNVEVRTLNERP